jgi:CRISPR-associated protein Cas5t
MATQTNVGLVALMPRWLDYWQNRQSTFAQYLLLQQRTLSSKFLQFSTVPQVYWTDPGAPQARGIPLGLVFHSFTGAADEALNLA